jgi:hypothetical protein
MTGEELRAWRVTTGYSQAAAAERFFRVTRTTLQNWEAGVTPIPYAVDNACKIWERRVRQEQAGYGPVTLVYSDGPMFQSPYGPQQTGSRLLQEQYAMNAQAIARVCALARGSGFYNPFVVERGGETLWNAVDLARVIDGTDDRAPTRANLLRRCAEAIMALAKNVRENPEILGFNGPRMPLGAEKQEKIRRVEDLANGLDTLAVAAHSGSVTYQQVEEITAAIRKLGKHPHSSFVSEVAKAFVDLSALDER